MSQTVPLTAGYELLPTSGLTAVWWLGGRLLAKVTGEHTGGRTAQLELHDPYGTAPPRHIHHREHETIFVLDGEVTVFVGDEQFNMSTGGFVFMPQGIEHTYLVRSQQARLLVTFAPAGFERFFAELGVPVVPIPGPSTRS
jgi:quercetin dioxygenase-like cupin family protein